jgi:hypothetical protein
MLLLGIAAPAIHAQTTTPGTPAEPVRILDGVVDLNRHDGGLSPAVGVEAIQVLRANRTHPGLADGFGFTYNHCPMLCYWNGTFYYEWISNTYGEQVAPGQTLVATSKDGRTWGMPKVVFPIYYMDVPPFRNATGQSGMAMMHHCTGFYVAPNGRLLVCSFYGNDVSAFGYAGIGRVVREAYKDGTYGPIYFVKYNPHYRFSSNDRERTPDMDSLPGWNEDNTSRPFAPGTAPMPVLYYRHSPDKGFIEACDAMLADPFHEMDWWEYDCDPSTLFPGGRATASNPKGLHRWEAPAAFHRKDGVSVSVWKWSGAALSTDDGKTWSNPVAVPSIITAGGKVWGQRTADGRFALVYNPANDGYHRWPLAVVTSDDGITFDHMLSIESDVYPRRYMGRAKDFGFQYIRGIPEGDGRPPGTDMWLVWSTKEDTWIGRVPVPVRGSVDGPVSEKFDEIPPGGEVPEWNIRRGPWIDVGVVPFPSERNRSLRLEDRDPYNYARAERIFSEGALKTISCRIYSHQSDTGQFNVEVLNHKGSRAVRIVFGPDGRVWVSDGAKRVDAGPYKADTWYTLDISVNASGGRFDADLGGKPIARGASFMEPADTVNRLCFRTGDLFEEPTRRTSRDYGGRDVPNAGEPAPDAVFNVDDVSVN